MFGCFYYKDKLVVNLCKLFQHRKYLKLLHLASILDAESFFQHEMRI